MGPYLIWKVIEGGDQSLNWDLENEQEFGRHGRSM